MIDLIKSSRWRNLKSKIMRNKKDNKFQSEIDLALMAAIENVHDIAQSGYQEEVKSRAYIIENINPIIIALAEDPGIREILKKNMKKRDYERIFYADKDKEEKPDVNDSGN